MKWIKDNLGISELIYHQKATNILLKKVIELQKHNINNDCEPHSRKKPVY